MSNALFHVASFAKAIRNNVLGTIMAVAVTLVAGAANATLIFTIERTSDQGAWIFATGSLDGSVPALTLDYLTLFNAVSGGGTSVFAGTSGDLELGGKEIQNSGVATGLPHLFILDFVAELSLGDTPTGKAFITLDASDVWAPVGTSDWVVWGTHDQQIVGNFSIIDANKATEPGMLALFALGLVGLGFLGRNRGIA